ncbi:MAG TPA: TolC family protein, partial [Phycisphaerales bacterium]|nr:TolC family protein [Phycisphaerales bacterium]
SNRELQAVYEELDIAQADLVQAGLLRNPVFSGEIRWSSDGGPGIVIDVAQDFVSVLLAPLRKARAQAAFESAKQRVTAAVLDLVGQTREAFYDLQASEQLLEMRRSVVEATAASRELAERLRAAGNNRELDVANERALHEQSNLDLAAAEADAIARRERMNELMGLWGDDASAWHITARMPGIPDAESDATGLERGAVERSLALTVARGEVEIAARELGIVKPLGSIDQAEIGIAAERETEGDWSLGPSLTLPIPLFDQGQAAIGAAGARLRQARERYFAAAVRVRAEARAAYAAATAARDRALYFERVMLPLRQTIVDETLLQYNAMQVGAFQLLMAKRDQIETGAQYVAALRDYWLARSRLDHILAGGSSRGMLHAALNQSMTAGIGSSRNGGH